MTAPIALSLAGASNYAANSTFVETASELTDESIDVLAILEVWVAIFATRTYESEDSMTKRTRPTVAQFISAKIHESGKSQIEIAEACGWPAVNMVTMVKQGKTRLPIDKIGQLAQVLEIEPHYLFWLTMAEYFPDTLYAIEHVIRGVMLNEHERLIIETYRDLTHGKDEDVELRVLGDVGRALKGGVKTLIRWMPARKNEVGLALAA